MNYSIDHISGNSYYVTLVPVTAEDRQLLEKNSGGPAIKEHYRKAIEQKFPSDIKIASLTPNDDFPCSVTIETFSVSGSV